jgi:allantoin racemase
MKLLYLEPNPMGLWNERIAAVLAQHKSPGTEVVVRHLDNLPPDVRSILLPKPPFFYSEMFRIIHQADREGFDAVIIGCSADPGVRDADDFASIPVIGPFKAALHIAGIVGNRMAVISPGDRRGKRRRPASWHRDSARLYGLADNVACFRTAPVDKPDEAELVKLAETDRARATSLLARAFDDAILNGVLAQAREAIEVDGATSIYLGCTVWGGSAELLQRHVGVPVIDPVVGPLKVAEMACAVTGPRVRP